MPVGECCGEGHLVGRGECEDKRDECFPGLGLWPLREVSRHNLDLMELAHLHRNIVENVEESSSSVDHSSLDDPASFPEDLSGISIVGHELARYFVPPDVLRERPGTEHADTVLSSPEGRVGDDDSRVWSDFGSRDGNLVEPRADPRMRVAMFLRQLLERLFLLGVFLPEPSTHSGISFR